LNSIYNIVVRNWVREQIRSRHHAHSLILFKGRHTAWNHKIII